MNINFFENNLNGSKVNIRFGDNPEIVEYLRCQYPETEFVVAYMPVIEYDGKAHEMNSFKLAHSIYLEPLQDLSATTIRSDYINFEYFEPLLHEIVNHDAKTIFYTPYCAYHLQSIQ